MIPSNNIIIFQPPSSCKEKNHSLPQGGIPMKIKHTHPVYTNEQERLDRLQDLKKSCIAKLTAGAASTKRTA